MDLIEKLAANVIDTTYDNLPSEAVEATKKGILDTLGCLIGGAAECRKEVDLVKEWGGKAESTILVYGGKVPALNAVWVNSSMAFALDYDGSGGAGPLHDLVCSVPAALAISEVKGNVSGKELITAIALGEDLAIRINNAGKDFGGFLTAGIVNVFSAAAISGKILGLDLNTMHNALGIASMKAAGSHQPASDKSTALRLLAGWASKSGVEASILAQRGFTGIRNVLQGFHGFYRVFTGGAPDIKILTDELGKRFEVARLQFKRFPSCGTTTAATEASLGLVQEFDIDPKKIRQITVETAKFTNSISGQPLTYQVGDFPDPVEGQFSQPYTVANAIIRRSSKLEHFTPRYMENNDIIELANRVIPVVNKDLEEISARVEIEMEDGKKYARLVNRTDMSPRKSLEEVKQKFAECVSFTPIPGFKEKANEIIEMVDKLEVVEDTSDLIKLLIAS